jgi:hypothetical protein
LISCMLGWRGYAVPVGCSCWPGGCAGRAARVSGQAPLAQSAERLHGKEKVYGSIP